MKKVLFIGDSLIEFFDWRSEFPGVDIANLGKAGETVEGLLARLGGITRRYPSADLVFLMTGINNAAMEDFDFLGSCRKVLEGLSASYPESRIFIHSLLPTLLPWVSNAALEEVNRSLAKVAEETGVHFVHLYRRFIDKEGMPVKEYLLPDGVHLSEKGYAVWAEVVKGIIEQ